MASSIEPFDGPLAAGMTNWAVGRSVATGSERISRTIRAKAVRVASNTSNTPIHFSATSSPYRR